MKEFADFVRESNNSDFARTPTWNDAVSLVESMPSAQPERKKGKWVQSALDNDFLTCSNCQVEKLKMRMAYRKEYANLFLYCPWCGADMKGKDDKR